MICLDTNVVIAFLKGTPAHLVARFEREIMHDDFALPVITLFELYFGAAKSSRPRENIERISVFLQLPIAVLPFEPADAEEAGSVRAALERAGTPIGPYDILIAAQARRWTAVLVSANTSEFARVSGLETQDWMIA